MHEPCIFNKIPNTHSPFSPLTSTLDSISSYPMASTPTPSSSNAPPLPPTPFYLLELSLISAQDLAPVSKSMRTYAVIWIHPTRKVTSRTVAGHTNPAWNERFDFRVDIVSLLSEDTIVTVEIYTISWFRDILVGTVHVLMSDLITPLVQVSENQLRNARFVALQVRRPSGTPQGILNMAVSILENTMRSKRLHNHATYPRADNFRGGTLKKVNSLSHIQPKNERDQEEGGKRESNTKIQLGRSLSMGSEVNNGSIVNGSEVCSDIGPSASIVAAELALKSRPPPSNQKNKMNVNTQVEDTGSSILEDLTMEEAKAKGYRVRSRDRWRKEMSMEQYDESEGSEVSSYSRHSRRNSDGGLFSCFGNAYGIEFTIVCGASNNAGGNKLSDSKSRRNKSSETISV